MSNMQLDTATFNRFARQGRRSSVQGLSETIRFLRRYQPEVLKQLKKDIASEIRPLVTDSVDEVNSVVTATLKSRGYQMFHGGATAWSGVRYTPQVTSNRQGLIKLKFTGKGGKLGYNYAELAGLEKRPPKLRSKSWPRAPRGYSYSGQGFTFNERLGRDFGKPGRFMWIRIIKKRTQINRQISQILERYNIKENAKLRGGAGRPGGIN
jgi:hypothetical protein